MNCLRCKGLMILDRFNDERDDTHQFEFTAWHCLNCGDVLDPVIAGYRWNTGNRNRHEFLADSVPGRAMSPT